MRRGNVVLPPVQPLLLRTRDASESSASPPGSRGHLGDPAPDRGPRHLGGAHQV